MKKLMVFALFTAAALSACAEGTLLELKGNVSVSFATQNPPAPAAAVAPATAFDDTIISGQDTLILTKVEIVLRQIEFQRVEVADCNVEECEEVEIGPVLVDLPLTPGADQQFTVEIPAGSYDEIDFEIHKVSSDAEDAAFRQAHPNFPVGQSIRVQGTFRGQPPFTYQTDLNVEQELEIVPPLAITDVTITNITIRVTLDDWFSDMTGALIDPDSANKGGPNESLVNDNIKQSLEAFEDRDGDGDERDG